MIMRYTERLWPGPGLFLAVALAMPISGLISMPVLQRAGVTLLWSIPIAAGVYILLCLWLRVMSPKLEVSGGIFRAGHVEIPIKYIGTCRVINRKDVHDELGLRLHLRSFKMTRGWVKDLVKISIIDPEDPTPYWIVSSRKPQKLVDAIKACPSDS
ncbi:DUF3093 domain-containing protein [Tropheryma whipplei]|uniref:DUF3093 domain-containing protein n=2 Tax=Tropheryma whipplei TaxID=2039 RepID=UPI0005713AE7|nr:DUF3093 domain-containing protein [Tropheryma whipplei]